MKEALPEIWEAETKDHHDQILQSAAVETVVRA